jgi:phage gp36-like protein
MPFLLRSDYEQLIRADQLNVVTDATDRVRTTAELAALTEMQSYLRGRYDLAAIFCDVLPYAAARQYAAGAVVGYQVPAVPGTGMANPGTPAGDVLLYVARRASKGETPDPAITPDVVADFELEAAAGAKLDPPAPVELGPAWTQLDPRNPLLVLYLIDLTLYHIHSRQAGVKVPQLRMDRYDMAIDWLKAARAGKMSTGLPAAPVTLPDGENNVQNIRARFGSLTKLNNSY